ncbi:ATP-binding protein [bacterium]|nr:ATP-binding protein [bacterium]
MRRLIDPSLSKWVTSPRRKPLIVRGARQVGKTFSVQAMGREQFQETVAIDLERNRDWHRVFAGSLDARRILSELELLTGKRIKPGRTLLFLDEIQACPRAIMAMRYFYEELPELHVAAAGSLLEFALGEISVPVGRVQYLEMHPMTFAEYLWGIGNDAAADTVQGKPRLLPETTHRFLLEELKRYCFVGGMPESILAYANGKSMQEAFDVQKELCETYRQDFAKYAPRSNPRCLDEVFLSVAQNLGQQIKYTRLAESFSGPTIKSAFDLLCKARVVKKIPSCDPSGLPLGASASSKRFKAILLDVGMWQHLSGMKSASEYAKEDLLSIYRGAMAEQFVGQEMMASQNSELHYWARQARSSTAEVDCLAVVDSVIRAVEVKSGVAGRLKSLHLLLKSYPNVEGGMVFSSGPYAQLPQQKLTFLPLYWASSATRSAHQV